MSTDKIVQLITRLSERTQQGALAWEETEREGVFQVSFSQNSVRLQLRQSRRYPDSAEYIVTVYNAMGAIVEEVSDENLQEEILDSYNLFKEMYEIARRKAIGVDETIDSILQDLDES